MPVKQKTRHFTAGIFSCKLFNGETGEEMLRSGADFSHHFLHGFLLVYHRELYAIGNAL